MSPLKTLDRGYSILQDQDEKTIKSVKQISTGDQLQARLSDGLADLKVKTIKEVKAIRKDGDIDGKR